MNLHLDFIEPYLAYIVLLFFVLLILYIKTYVSEKAKIKALKNENEKLVNETERIKKDFQLEIAKRKYQYESKKEQYLKFFKLLDEFSNENNIKTQEKFFPIVEEFNRNYLNATSNETNAITVFSKKIQKLMLDANQDLLRIKQETNTIRLIASDAVLQKLDLLTLAYDNSMEVSNKTMNYFLYCCLTIRME